MAWSGAGGTEVIGRLAARLRFGTWFGIKKAPLISLETFSFFRAHAPCELLIAIAR